MSLMHLYGAPLPTFSIFGFFSLLLAIVVAILAFVFIVPERRAEKLNKFGKFLHNTLNFKYLIIEKILQFIYIVSTVFVILYSCFNGFLMLFNFVIYGARNPYFLFSSLSSFLMMVLGPIVIRLIYELLLMAIILVKNVISINNKLKNQNGNNNDDPFNAPDISEFNNVTQSTNATDYPIPDSADVYNGEIEENSVVCPKCGMKIANDTAFCPQCGTSLQNQ